MLAKILSWFAKRPPAQSHVRYTFDGHTITAGCPETKSMSLPVEDIREIGIETTDLGPFVEDVFWLLNRETDALRIPQDSPAFQELMDYFGTLPGFDWQPFNEAMSCTDCRYFLCWRRPNEPA